MACNIYNFCNSPKINASLFCNKHAKKREAEKEFNQFIHVVLITFEALQR